MKDQEHDDNVTASDNSEEKKTSLRTDGEIGRSGWVN